jgi:hypothetical protein
MKRLVCRLRSHKWVRLETFGEEKAYRCSCCGELHYPEGDPQRGRLPVSETIISPGGVQGFGDGGGGGGDGGGA